mgnify:CR=1 FL=1
MKIVLEAFGGKLKSAPMDVPESTYPIFKLALTQPLTAIMGFSEKIGEIPAIQTICEFEFTGNYYGYSGGESARIYVLKDIVKTNH